MKRRRTSDGPLAEGTPRTARMQDPLCDDDPLIGKTLGKYRILERIGQGAVGKVYLAEDPLLKRKVAIKVLIKGDGPDADANRFDERFIREARIGYAVDHPNVVGFIDINIDHDSGIIYLVMEHIEGQTLNEVLNKGRLSWERAQYILLQICEGLGAMHDRGIVNRDLKPGNMIITDDDCVKLIDLGLAKPLAARMTEDGMDLAGEGMDLTREDMIVGTPDYMSPEQCKGTGTDQRSDIYSLGVIMYEMLTGKKPFEGETERTVMAKQIRDPPKSPREQFPELKIPLEVDAIVMRALEKEPEKRFQNTGEIADAIRKCPLEKELEDEPGIVKKSSTARRVLKWAAVVVGLGAVGSTSYALYRHKREALWAANAEAERQEVRAKSTALYDKLVKCIRANDTAGIETVIREGADIDGEGAYIKKGAYINGEPPAYYGDTPLMLAVFGNKFESVKALLKYNPNLRVEKTFKDKEISRIARVSDESSLRITRSGKEFEIRMTPLNYAEYAGYTNIAELLKAHLKAQEKGTPGIAPKPVMKPEPQKPKIVKPDVKPDTGKKPKGKGNTETERDDYDDIIDALKGQGEQ